MMFPKIKLGKEANYNGFFDISKQFHTTSSFGFMQPYFSKLMMANSSLDLDVQSVVRLMPMPVPTMGKMSLKAYNVFVPIADLVENFESLLAEKPYSSQRNISYIPQETLYITPKFLFDWLLSNHANYTEYRDETFSFTNEGEFPLDNLKYESGQSQTSVNANLLRYGSGVQFNHNPNTGSDKITPEGADIVIPYKVTGSSGSYFCLCQWDGFADRFLKIVHGLGFQLSNSSDHVSFLPFLAYYKAWFDLFAIQRDITWTQTNAYKLISQCIGDNTSLVSAKATLIDFLEDLVQTFYTFDPDFISSHIASTALSTQNTSLPYILPDGSSNQVSMIKDRQPTTYGGDSLSDIKIRLLRLATKIVNKNTIIGGKIDDYLRVHYGAVYQHNLDSLFIGSFDVPCEISDVMCNTQSDFANLGEYAGRGLGSNWNSPSKLKYHANTMGYWIGFCTLVPTSGYCQGIHPDNFMTTRLQFPTPIYDAVGYEVTSKLSVYGSSDSYHTSTYLSGGFGFTPRYTGHKISFDTLSGAFAKRSTRSSLLPYCLNRIIGFDYTPVTHPDGHRMGSYIRDPRNDEIVTDNRWRYCSKYGYIGSYNRIFYNSDTLTVPRNSGLVDDNFIISMFCTAHYHAPLHSISTSFDTDGDLDSIEVTKA